MRTWVRHRFLVGSVLLIFLVFCVVFFVFVFVLFVIVLFLVCPILPMSVSGLSVLHCPFSFVYRLITHYNVVEIGETKQRDHFIAGKTSVSLLLGTYNLETLLDNNEHGFYFFLASLLVIKSKTT